MKRIPAALMALCMLVSLCGCATVVPKKTWEDEFAKGEEHLSLGEFEAAKRSFEAAIELEPTQTTPYIGLITACFRLGKVAIDACRDYEAQRKAGKNPVFRAADIGMDPDQLEWWK